MERDEFTSKMMPFHKLLRKETNSFQNVLYIKSVFPKLHLFTCHRDSACSLLLSPYFSLNHSSTLKCKWKKSAHKKKYNEKQKNVLKSQSYATTCRRP